MNEKLQDNDDAEWLRGLIETLSDEYADDVRDRLERIASRLKPDAELLEALTKCRELFYEIRMDWSDPRSECREGMALIDEALSSRGEGEG